MAGDLVTVPLSGSSSPASTLSSVDLPTPFGATIPMRSPAPMLRLTPSSTTRLPKETLTLAAVSLDIETPRSRPALGRPCVMPRVTREAGLKPCRRAAAQNLRKPRRS